VRWEGSGRRLFVRKIDETANGKNKIAEAGGAIN
jgi:hypothetical protein